MGGKGAYPGPPKIEVGGSWPDFGNFLVGVGNLDFYRFEGCSIDSEQGPKQGLRIGQNDLGTILRHHQNHLKNIKKSCQNHVRIM